jgi:hypothetical protein
MSRLEGSCGVRALAGSRITSGDSLTVGIDSPQIPVLLDLEKILQTVLQRSVAAM